MKFFTAALVLTLAVAANASIHALGLGVGSTAIHAPHAWAAAPYAGAWIGAPAALTAWGAPAAVHWGTDDGQWRGDAPGHDGQWLGEGHWAGQDIHDAVPVAAVIAAHAAPLANNAAYVAANRGSQHVAPLPGHVQSVKSLNVQPAPGTW